jgi:6-hydroxycyclohex-1-ene-1-carbonyl-CoA dehydrogenase
MKAAIFRGSRTLTLEQVPVPEAGPGEIVVKVAACGVCHTDLHYTDHGVATAKKPPIILGHEASGVVHEVGGDVTAWKPGDRVLLPAVLTCGYCELCRMGRENICLNMKMFGNHVDGAFAEFVRAPAKDAIAVPPELPLEEACVIADAASTPYHAVTHRGKVRPGERVVVFGCGGVGVNAVQFAAAAGASVVAVDLDPAKLETARQLGAAEIVHAGEEDVVRRVKALTSGGADAAFECIGNPATVRQAADSIRRGGRVVVVGFCGQPVELNVGRVMFFEQEIIGSLGCRPVDYPRVLRMAAAGRIRISQLVSGRYPLDRVNEAFDALRTGKGLRRIVTMNSHAAPA